MTTFPGRRSPAATFFWAPAWHAAPMIRASGMAGAILVGVMAFALARRRQRSWLGGPVRALMQCSIRPSCRAAYA
ncbi:DUF6691 family protein [Cupriavidus necator]